MKKLISLFVVMILLLTAASVFAEDTTITVDGTGEIRVSADTAVISLGVSARNKDVLAAQQEVNASIASIRQALIGEGVKEEDINTEFINIYAMYDYQDGEEMLEAYNASSTLAIKVTDMEKVGSLIDAAFAAGANTLNGITFSASDTKDAENEALKDAVLNAGAKAEVLAEASGLKITGVKMISEGSVFNYENNVGNVYAKSMDAAAESAAGTVVQAAKMIVSATVSVTYTAEENN